VVIGREGVRRQRTSRRAFRRTCLTSIMHMRRMQEPVQARLVGWLPAPPPNTGSFEPRTFYSSSRSLNNTEPSRVGQVFVCITTQPKVTNRNNKTSAFFQPIDNSNVRNGFKICRESTANTSLQYHSLHYSSVSSYGLYLR
jgi:hypothetical protein